MMQVLQVIHNLPIVTQLEISTNKAKLILVRINLNNSSHWMYTKESNFLERRVRMGRKLQFRILRSKLINSQVEIQFTFKILLSHSLNKLGNARLSEILRNLVLKCLSHKCISYKNTTKIFIPNSMIWSKSSLRCIKWRMNSRWKTKL